MARQLTEKLHTEISVVTSNISAGFLAPPGVPPWEERKTLYTQVLRSAEPDLIGLQEVIPHQLHFLQTQLPEFVALTVPVTNPDPDLVAIWQAKYGKFGLSQIPNPYEIVLFYRINIVEFMVDLCRQEMAELTGRAALRIFMGDMNFNPSTPEYALLRADGWRDSHEAAAGNEEATFLYDMPDIPGGRIDHILYQDDGLAPQTWSRLQSPDPERRVSDHDPVYVRFWMDDASQNDCLADHL